MTRPAAPPIAAPLSRARRLRRWVGAAGLWGLLCLATLGCTPAADADLASQVIDIDHADVTFAGETGSTVVALPDTWGQRGRPTFGQAHYRARFTLDAAVLGTPPRAGDARPQHTWALRAIAMSGRHEIRLNDQLISGQHLDEAALDRSQPEPQWVVLPPALLIAGTNTLDITLGYGTMGGLSALQIGPAPALRRSHARDWFLRHTLPVTLNVGGVVLGLAMLFLWRRHPGETFVGMVGALWTVGSVRNLLEFGLQRLPKEAWLDVGNFTLQLGGLALMCFGSNLLARGALQAWMRPALWLVGLGALATALATPFGAYLPVRNALVMLMTALAAGLLAASLRHVTWARHRTRPALAVALMLAIIAAAHDFLDRLGVVPMDQQVWLPLGLPMGLAITAWALLGRTSRALSRTQDLNQELERRVTQRTTELQRATQAKSRFLASASHDLRQPVVTIGLLVGLLRDQKDAAQQRQMIDRVDQAVAAMEDLLKGLLDLSRLEAGTVTPRRQRVALQRVFDAISTHEAEAARLKGLRLRFRPTALTVLTDPVLLEQILRNLVSNALRYTTTGGVLVGCRRRGERVWVQVWDTGCGIAPEQQGRVFEEFVQLDNPARDRTRGLGLGLAIVSRAAQLLTHRMTMRSQAERGSCFSIELPVTAAPQAVTQPPPADPLPLRGLRVALIEDEHGVREAVADRLRHWGATVSAFEGWHALQSHAEPLTTRWTDLIISDQRLPDGSGVAVIAWIRQRQGTTPAVLITGNTDPQDLSQMHQGHVPVLHKPFRAEALLHGIRQAMRPNSHPPD